jgi:Flp pilus assembly pilin Flp
MQLRNLRDNSPIRDRSQRGASVVEYALLVSLILGVCILAINNIGTATNNKLTNSGILQAFE